MFSTLLDLCVHLILTPFGFQLDPPSVRAWPQPCLDSHHTVCLCVANTLCHYGLIKVQSESSEKLEHANTYRASTGCETQASRVLSVTLADMAAHPLLDLLAVRVEVGLVEIICSHKSVIENVWQMWLDVNMFFSDVISHFWINYCRLNDWGFDVSGFSVQTQSKSAAMAQFTQITNKHCCVLKFMLQP